MKNRRKIFVPFIDGILKYDCRECGYGCCQSGFIVMNAKEKRILLQDHPSLRYFYVRKTKKTYVLRKYPRCWFLENSGLCYVQKKYGYSSKPFICRLHPFYIVRCESEYVVVPRTCSTLHAGRGNKNKDTSHKHILKNAQEAVNLNVLSGEINWSGKRLELEKKILEESKHFLNNSSYLDFSVYQISIATEGEDMAKITSELLEFVELWKSFLEINELNMENKSLTYELTAITSLVRVESFELRQMEVKKVPLALLALYFYTVLFSKDRKVKTCVGTYKGILNNISLGLSYLKKDDLNIKSRSIEDKIDYLRLLQKIHVSKLMRKRK